MPAFPIRPVLAKGQAYPPYSSSVLVKEHACTHSSCSVLVKNHAALPLRLVYY